MFMRPESLHTPKKIPVFISFLLASALRKHPFKGLSEPSFACQTRIFFSQHPFPGN